MTGFASTWANAPADGNGESNPPPPPDNYNFALQDGKAFTSKAGNEVMITEFRVLDGTKAGYIFPVISTFKSEGATTAAKALASGLGVDVEQVSSLEELDAQLKLQIGNYYEGVVKANGDFLNTYINGKVTGSSVPISDVPNGDAPTHTPVGDDDDLPF